jgi:Xaa-Pro aminopeptidase
MAVSKELPQVKFVDGQMLMLNMRWYKSDEEIRFMRRSGYIADKGNEAMINAASIGVNDLDIWYEIDKACARAGAPQGGFHIYGSGPWRGKRSNLFSAPGSERNLQAGDVLAPEIGSEYKGYYTQLTVPVSLGTPTDEFYRDLEVCRKVYDHMMTQFRPGKTTKGLDEYGAEYTKDLTDGEVTLVFAFQCGEIERAFYLDDYEIRVGATGYNQPLFVRTDGGPIWHVFGNAVVCTDGDPIRLHQSPMDVVIV